MVKKILETVRYSKSEECVNALSHWLGVLLGIVGLAVLVRFGIKNHSTPEIVAFSIYGGCFIFMYLASAVYHTVPLSKAKGVLRIFDHSAIFLFIAASYMPIAILSFSGWLRIATTAVVWAIAIAGVIFKILTAGAFNRTKKLSLFLYLLLGWFALLLLKPIVQATDIRFLLPLVLGGVIYSVGAVFYAKKNLKFNHAIWHIFVLAGSVVHYVGILNFYALR